jgi:hypothetical protein
MRLERLKLYDAQIALLFARARGGGSVGNTVLLTGLTQPALGGLVTAHVTSTADMLDDGFVTILGGGRYTVANVVDATHVELLNIGGKQNAPPATLVPNGSVVSLQSPNALASLGPFSPYAIAPVVNVLDPRFGVVGDDVHDDQPNIATAAAFAATVGAVVLWFQDPPVAYRIGAPLVPIAGQQWRGPAVTMGQATIRAGAAMREMLDVTSTNYSANAGLTTIDVSGLTLDGNFLADYCVHRHSDFFCHYSEIFALNARIDHFHGSSLLTPVAFGSITQTGGGPAIVGPITAPDPLYTGLAGTTHVFLKIAPSGTDFLVSLDGGVTYGVATQPINGPANVAGVSGTVIVQDLGFQVPWPAGPFTPGTTYDFVATFPPGAGSSVNVEVLHRNLRCTTAGSIACSAGLFATYIGLLPTAPTVLAGLASITPGSQIITFNAPTGLLALNLRNGDAIFVQGFPNAIPIWCVLNDQAIAIGQADAAALSLTLTNVDWAVGKGACIWQDTAFSGDNGRNAYEGECWFSTAPQLMRLTGTAQGVGNLTNCRLDNFYAFWALQLGGGGQAGTSYVSTNTECKTATIASARFCFLGQNVVGTFLEPQQNFVAVGSGSGTVHRGGSMFPIGSGAVETFVPLGVEQIENEFVAITAAGQALSAPTFNDPFGGKSITEITLSATFLSTATPLVPATTHFDPNLTPCKQIVNRDTTHAFTIEHDFISLSGVILETSQLTLGPGEGITLYELPNGKYATRGAIGRNYTANTGSQSDDGGRPIAVTDAAPHSVFDASSAGFLPGAQYRAEISAERAANDVAHWTDIIIHTDNNGAILATNFTGGGLDVTNPIAHSATAGAATWTTSQSLSGGQLHILFTGDGAAGTIFVRSAVHMVISPAGI